jgi:hypothetical protein
MTNTVLVVDEDSNLLDSLRRLLRRKPYRLLRGRTKITSHSAAGSQACRSCVGQHSKLQA